MMDKYLLQYLITATRGGLMRGRILDLLRKKPMNMHQIAKGLKIDYKTAQHHLRVLAENNAISAINKGKYGAAYHWSRDMEENSKIFDEIWIK